MNDVQRDQILDAMSELGAAISQSVSQDDQIIMDHVRRAHDVLRTLYMKSHKEDAQ